MLEWQSKEIETMARLEVNLSQLKVHDKNEWSKDEAYLWCFGLVIDDNTIRSKNYILKRKPNQGNLGKGMKKGETRAIPAEVGRITTTVTPVRFGNMSFAVVGTIVLAWEEDNTPGQKVVQAYDDSVEILKDHVDHRVRTLNVGPLTPAEIAAISADLKKAIEKRFRSAVHWYNPFSWDPDDFIGFAQVVESVQPNQTLNRPIDFLFTESGAKYQVTGQLRYVP
jgi:hypothetical protein